MITIIEPVLGVLVSNLAKRAVGEPWSKAQTISMFLELMVDYVILIFLVFMATSFKTNELKYDFLSYQLTLSKEGWSFVFLLCVICAALCWKQSRKQIFTTVKFKSSPRWLMCLVWNIPNIAIAYLVTFFLFGVVAV